MQLAADKKGAFLVLFFFCSSVPEKKEHPFKPCTIHCALLFITCFSPQLFTFLKSLCSFLCVVVTLYVLLLCLPALVVTMSHILFQEIHNLLLVP